MARVRSVPGREKPPPAQPDSSQASSSTVPDSASSPDPSSIGERRSSKSGHDELKHLQDSLTSFYTPSTSRRCRMAPKKFDDQDVDRLPQALSVDVESEPRTSAPVSSSSGGSRKTSTVSPSRRAAEKLVDSLSPYFTAPTEKRRRPDDLWKRANDYSPGSSPVRNVPIPPPVPGSAVPVKKMPRGRKTEEIRKVVGGRATQNSASAALFGSLTEETSPSTSEDVNMTQRRKSRTKYDYGEKHLSPTSPRRRKSSQCITSPSSSTSAEKENIGGENVDFAEIEVPADVQASFDAVQKKIREQSEAATKSMMERITEENKKGRVAVTQDPRIPGEIIIGRHKIKTWYGAPYPQEYAHLPVLYLCEFCLRYVKNDECLAHHKKKCNIRHPPGREIYRYEHTSVFEVDGNVESQYCQNLCLLGKLFIDHKCLYYDVEPFLFYVVTANTEQGYHFVGYFSKEKYNHHIQNLSCLVILPPYQQRGYGRFLIDFSFLLTRREGLTGTPEKPLSEIGKLAYSTYWRIALFTWIRNNVKQGEKFVPKKMIIETGICAEDVCKVFEGLGWYHIDEKGHPYLKLDYEYMNLPKFTMYPENSGGVKRVRLNENSLKWIPSSYSPQKDFGMCSPVRLSTTHQSPVTPTTAHVGSTPTGVCIAAVGSTVKKGCGPSKSSKRGGPRRLNLSGTRAPNPEKENNATSSDTDTVHDGCKEPRRFSHHESSPDDTGASMSRSRIGHRHHQPSTSNSTTNASTSRPTTTGRKKAMSRGKSGYGDDSDSSSTSSSEDDLDRSFELGRGRKPQKGKGGKGKPPQRRRRPVGRKSGKGKFPEKKPPVGNQASDRENDVETPPPADSPPLRCESAASSVATVPMRQTELGTPQSPGGNRTLEDVEDDLAASVPIPIPTVSTSASVCRSPVENHHRESSEPFPDKRAHSPALSSGNNYNSDNSDAYESQPPSRGGTLSNNSSRVVSPRPIGDRISHGHGLINMGGFQDDDDNHSRNAPFEDNDNPPQLQAEQAPSVHSSDDAPPLLTAPPGADFVPNHAPDDYATDDDDVPPCLSPICAQESDPAVSNLSDEQKDRLVLDKMPNAPQSQPTEPEMTFGSGQPSLEAASSSSVPLTNPVSTPLQTYPGSLKQTTPGSVPSCQMQNQSTPEAASGAFLSPQMNPTVQPSSVSSAHSTHNSSLDNPNTSGQSFSQMPSSSHSNPSTPLRSSMHGPGPSFGSPPLPLPQMSLRTSTETPAPTTATSRRSGESRKHRTQAAASSQAQTQIQPVQQYIYPSYPGYAYPPAGYPFEQQFQPNWNCWPNPYYPQYKGNAAAMAGMVLPNAVPYPYATPQPAATPAAFRYQAAAATPTISPFAAPSAAVFPHQPYLGATAPNQFYPAK